MKLNKEQRIRLRQYALEMALSFNEEQPSLSGKYEGGCPQVVIAREALLVKADAIYDWLTEQ